MSVNEIIGLVICLVVGLPALVFSFIDVYEAYKRLRQVLRLEKQFKKELKKRIADNDNQKSI